MNRKNALKIMSLFALVGLLTGCPGPEKPTEEPTAPTVAPAAEQPVVEQAPMAPANDTYLVVRGDSLWKISGKPDIYNNPYHWPLIYKANRDKIKDADLIQPGQELTIERGASSADVDAAVEHAKTRGAWSLGVTEESDKAYLAR